MILLAKRQTMSDVDFARYLLEEHSSLAKKMPGTSKYVVNIVQRSTNNEPNYHAVSELWFDDPESVKKAFSSPKGNHARKTWITSRVKL
jgi:uncharacterized protein (TIGR02118 family)